MKAKRTELRKRLDWRRDVAGLPEHVRDELVDEAIGLVVMSSKPIRDEQHLQGAFWTSIRLGKPLSPSTQAIRTWHVARSAV